MPEQPERCETCRFWDVMEKKYKPLCDGFVGFQLKPSLPIICWPNWARWAWQYRDTRKPEASIGVDFAGGFTVGTMDGGKHAENGDWLLYFGGWFMEVCKAEHWKQHVPRCGEYQPREETP